MSIVRGTSICRIIVVGINYPISIVIVRFYAISIISHICTIAMFHICTHTLNEAKVISSFDNGRSGRKQVINCFVAFIWVCFVIVNIIFLAYASRHLNSQRGFIVVVVIIDRFRYYFLIRAILSTSNVSLISPCGYCRSSR